MIQFKFNDKLSYDDLGIVVKELPQFKAQRKIEYVKVNGRNGNLHIDDNCYNAISTSIVCMITDVSKIDLIKETLEGTHQLELSTVEGRYYIATVKNQIDFKVYLKVLKQFSLELEVEPFAYDKTETTLNETATSTFVGGGNTDSYPTLTITGTGTISLNNNEIAVTETGISIDCELMNCTNNNINKNDKVTLTEFPKVLKGTNNLTVGTGITNVEIVYRKRWL